MYLTDATKNFILDSAIDEAIVGGFTHASLHTAYSTTGANELTGGAPAYARKALTWAAAASGSKALAATLPTFDVPASTTVRWLGFWTALTAGTFRGMVPLGGGTLKHFTVDDTTADTLKSEGHGFANGDQVVVWGAGIPTDLAVGTIYFVVTAATDTLQLALTSGGAAINFADKGAGFLQKIVPETFGAQGTYAVSAASVDLGAVQ